MLLSHRVNLKRNLRQPKRRKKRKKHDLSNWESRGSNSATQRKNKTISETGKAVTNKSAIPNDVPVDRIIKSGPTKEANPRSEVCGYVQDGEKRRPL